MSVRAFPVLCPSCREVLQVNRLQCEACGAAVEGRFDLPPLARLDAEEQELVVSFVKTSGSLKDLARLCGVSYPTVRNRLDSLIDKLGALDSGNERKEGNESHDGTE